jgi:hypothetical protein
LRTIKCATLPFYTVLRSSNRKAHQAIPSLDIKPVTMKVFQLLLSSALALGALAAPHDEMTKRADRGSYTVSGLGSRKQAILNAGGNTLDLAIAMLET